MSTWCSLCDQDVEGPGEWCLIYCGPGHVCRATMEELLRRYQELEQDELVASVRGYIARHWPEEKDS